MTWCRGATNNICPGVVQYHTQPLEGGVLPLQFSMCVVKATRAHTGKDETDQWKLCLPQRYGNRLISGCGCDVPIPTDRRRRKYAHPPNFRVFAKLGG